MELLDRYPVPDREQELQLDEVLTQLRHDLLSEDEAAQQLWLHFGWPMERSRAEITAYLR
jgi:hypothetical protein